MELSRSLLRSFARTINDDSRNKKVTNSMSGTVVMSGDRKFVKIDGSEALTPVFETVDIQEGDRVYVSIENHQASVIGNYSYPPSARVANQANAMAADGILKVDALTAISITTENLTAHSATITNLVAQNINAGYAKITELDALKANIETLSGDVLNYKNATFEQLNATIGRIDNLSGDVLAYKNATFEQLEAAEGKITKLEGDVVSYKNATFEELEATKGQIDELNGNFISYKEAVFEQLEAAEGKITNLEGDYLEYKQAVLNELQAQDAIITNLSGDFASYKEVMAGELVAAKGWMLDGSIGNAQISNLNATKITSGILDTSLITVKGSNGKLQIADNTMQISDSNRVRVQIGKDASNDYSMSVWDQNGLLIWDALGATENTIQRKIIRDKMVADDAAIQALKIDFQSFETALTNQGVTISGTVVQVGDKTLNVYLTEQSELITDHGELISDHSSQISANQTAIGLRVTSQEYETYKSSVDGQLTDIGSRMTSAESSITTLQGQISLKVEQTDIDNAVSVINGKFDNYSTTTQMQSAINASKSSILSSVSETYSTKSELASVDAVANSKNRTYEGSGSPNYTGEGNIVALFTNRVSTSITEDGSVFNGTGYQDGMRVRSGGALGAQTGFVATGFIPVKAGDVIRFTCSSWSTKEAGNSINFGYISNGAYTSIGSYTTQPASYGIYLDSGKTNSNNIPSEESPGVWKVTVPNDSSITHYRMSCFASGADLIVTVNEEIAYGEAGAEGNPYSPSVEWKTAGTEADHVGDLYLDTDTNHLYRWGLYDGEYKWQRVNDDEISKVVSLESWKAEASILLTKDGIVSTVGNYYAYQSDLSSATNRIAAAESVISQHADAISLRVEKAGVISAINQTSESITIDASKINLSASNIVNIIGGSTVKIAAKNIDLSGYVTATDLSTKGKTTIVGDNITSGTITGITFKGVTGDFSGKITATSGTIGGWNITASRILSSSTIYSGAAEAGLMLINETDKPYMIVQDSGGNSTFSIARTGKVTVVSGTIGCWDLTSTRFYDSAKTAGINKNGQGMAFWAGGSDITGNAARFKVDHNGHMTLIDGGNSQNLLAYVEVKSANSTNPSCRTGLWSGGVFVVNSSGYETGLFDGGLMVQKDTVNNYTYIEGGSIRTHHIYMGENWWQGTERQIAFQVSSGTYPHHTYIYGGNSNSDFAIGVWDNKNSVSVWRYNDVYKTLEVNATFILKNGFEIYGTYPNIDFHYNNNGSSDYTSRIIEMTSGVLQVNGVKFSSSNITAARGSFYGTYTSTLGSRYGNQALEIRENGLVTNTQSDIGYAPAIGFHWAGRIAASLVFHNDGGFRFMNQAYTDFVPVFVSTLYLGGAPYGQIYCGTSYQLYINPRGSGAVYIGYDNRCIVPPSGGAAIRGNGDGTYDCGHTSYLWGTVYAKNGVKTTSDEREKDIMSLDLSELSDCFMSIKPIAFRWKYGNDKKIHLGVGAQTTERKMIEAGYDPSQFDMIQHDDLEERSVSGLMERYGINYQDLNMLTMMQTQKTTREFTTFLIGFKEWKDTVDVDLSLFKDEQDELKEEVQNLKIEFALANQKIAELSAKTA